MTGWRTTDQSPLNRNNDLQPLLINNIGYSMQGLSKSNVCMHDGGEVATWHEFGGS